MIKNRSLNCDILRIMAFLFVLAVHSLSYIGFYSETTTGPTMLILNIVRCLFITCVPLFLVLTGYLMSKKELTKDYIKKLSRIIITYLLCSIVCLICLHFIEKRPIGTIKDYFFEILSFQAAPYSWYVNMYIGLYLIIPFLNILWKNLKDKKQKQYLIIVLLILIVSPTIFNIYNWQDFSWWLNPSRNRAYQQIVPNFWQGGGYPILYYYIGSYLKEYKLNITWIKNIVLLIIGLIIFGTFNFYRNYNNTFEWGIYVDYYSFEAVIITILITNLILNFKKLKLSERLNKIIAHISYLTFGGYLLSKIFDMIFYPYLTNNTTTVLERCFYAVPTVLLIGICSIILSGIIDMIQKLTMILKNKIKKVRGYCE